MDAETRSPQPELAGVVGSGAPEPPVQPRQSRLRGPGSLRTPGSLRAPAGLGRRPVLAVGAAAAVVLLGGVVAMLSGHAPGSASPALAAVSGCTALGQVSGTLEQVGVGDLVIKTASGRLAEVATTSATRVAVSGNLLRDITDGAPVAAAGPSSGGTIAAARIAVGGKASLAALPGTVVAQGTVADATPGGFTVVTSTGARVPVTTSSGTSVIVLPASLAQLQAGAQTIAVGHTGPGKTLSAVALFQPPPTPPGAHVSVTLGDCTSTSIDRALKALASVG